MLLVDAGKCPRVPLELRCWDGAEGVGDGLKFSICLYLCCLTASTLGTSAKIGVLSRRSVAVKLPLGALESPVRTRKRRKNMRRRCASVGWRCRWRSAPPQAWCCAFLVHDR